MDNIEAKARNLRSGIQELAHNGELDVSAVIALGPVLGIVRGDEGGSIVFSDDAYMAQIHKQLTEPEGIQRLEKYYGSLTVDVRIAIGRAVNALRNR